MCVCARARACELCLLLIPKSHWDAHVSSLIISVGTVLCLVQWLQAGGWWDVMTGSICSMPSCSRLAKSLTWIRMLRTN